MAAERGRSDFDVRHRLAASYIYELPFGKDKRYLTQGTTSHIIGGWQINGITTLPHSILPTASAS